MASSFVVFLDAGSLILSFYRPFIFMFSVFSAVLVLLFSRCFSPLIITTAQLANSTECTGHEVLYNHLQY